MILLIYYYFIRNYSKVFQLRNIELPVCISERTENMNNADVWNITPCSSCENRSFRERYHLYHEGDKNRRARNVNNNYLVTMNVVPNSLILVTLMMEAILPLKHRFLQELHCITSHKLAFF
jgi:hypothetical protein